MNEQRKAFEAWAKNEISEEFEGAQPEGRPWYFFDDEMQTVWWAWQAALSSQPPKEAMSDAEIFDLYSKCHVEYAATVLVRNEFTDQDEYKTVKQSCFSPPKFADAIAARTSPNKELVEALHELIECMEHEVTSKHPALEVARAALASVGEVAS